MRGTLKMSEEMKQEWTEVTQKLLKSYSNLDEIPITAYVYDAADGRSMKEPPIIDLIKAHFADERRPVGVCAKALGVKYNVLYTRIYLHIKCDKEFIKKLCKLLDIPPEAKGDYFDGEFIRT